MNKKTKKVEFNMNLTTKAISILMAIGSIFYVLKAAPVLFISGILLFGAYFINPERKKIKEFFKGDRK